MDSGRCRGFSLDHLSTPFYVMFWCSDIDWEFSHLSWSTSITSIVIRSSFVRSQDAASARQLQVSK